MLRVTIIYFLITIIFISCKSEKKAPNPEKEPDTIKQMPDDMAMYDKFGDSSFKPAKPIEAVMADEVLNDQDSFYTEVKGKVVDVCREAGCWCDIQTDKSKRTLHVRTGGNFYLDTTALNKEAFFAGYLYRQEDEEAGKKAKGEVTYWATAAWIHK